MHENWCELNQGGLHCDCGAEGGKPGETREMTIRRKSRQHATWCNYPSGPCDCGCDEHPA